MRIIAYINWVFFLILFSAFGFVYQGIDGLDKSYDNNYFEEQHLDEGLFFSDTVKILATLSDTNIYIDSFPFHLFSHLVIDRNRHISTFKNYHKKLIEHKEKLNLEEKALLLSIELEDAINSNNRNVILDEAYKILDELKKHFPNSEPGLVFDLDADRSRDAIKDDLANLEAKLLAKNKNYNNYLSLRYLNSEGQYDVNFFKNKLPNYEGQFIKTFDERQDIVSLTLFNRMATLIDTLLSSNEVDKANTIFCFPTYPLIQKKHEKAKVFGLDEVAADLKHIKYGENENLLKYSKNKGHDTIFFNNYKYLEKTDTTYKTYPKIKVILDTSTTGVIDTIRDTSYVKKTAYKKTAFFFEDEVTLESKIEYAIRKGINIGFWNCNKDNVSIIHLDESASGPKNPIIGLFKFAKGNFVKKIARKPQSVVEILIKEVYSSEQNAQIDWSKTDTWYWQTIERHMPKPKRPDYVACFLIPLFVLKILLPLFILIHYTRVNTFFGGHFFKSLKVNLFNAPVSAFTVLRLDILFWIFLFIVFMFNWYSSVGNGYTTRNFSILLILIAILGRPIVKFIIKLIKLVGKPFKFKKVIKLLPYLGEMIYYNITQEEKEKSVAYIRTVDSDRYVYDDSKQDGDDNADQGNEEDEDYRRWIGFMAGEKYNDKTKDEDKVPIDTSIDKVDMKGQGRMEIPKWLVVLFKSLFVVFSVALVWYFEFERFDGFDLEKIDIYYVLVSIIFIVEIVIIAIYFFRDYYLFYLTKLFARNV